MLLLGPVAICGIEATLPRLNKSLGEPGPGGAHDNEASSPLVFGCHDDPGPEGARGIEAALLQLCKSLGKLGPATAHGVRDGPVGFRWATSDEILTRALVARRCGPLVPHRFLARSPFSAGVSARAGGDDIASRCRLTRSCGPRVPPPDSPAFL